MHRLMGLSSLSRSMFKHEINLLSKNEVRRLIRRYHFQKGYPLWFVKTAISQRIHSRFEDDKTRIKALEILERSVVEEQGQHDQQDPRVEQ